MTNLVREFDCMKARALSIVLVIIVANRIVTSRAASTDASGPREATDLKLGALFGDHMVVQRDRPLRVWGEAIPGAAVEVRIGPRRADVKASPEGRWEVVLEPLPAGGPHDLRAASGGEVTQVLDLLVGDVWLCSGQSNMQMSLKESDGGPAAAAASGALRNLRMATVGRKAGASPQGNCDIRWRVPAPEAAREFSAVGLYFAAALRADPALKDLPLGVIDSSFGGSMCEAWVPKEALAEFDPASLHVSLFGAAPSGYYNAMIAPLTRNPIRGVVWYQGEGNAGAPGFYPDLLVALIRSWRERFASPRLPFVVIQLPDWMASSDGYSWAWIREAQAKAVRATPHTSLALGLRTTDGYNLHPREKAEIGRRAALCALRDVYERPVVASGPTFKGLRAEGRTLRVEFNAAEGGLATRDGRRPRQFAVAGADGKYFYADAVIDGNAVLLKCESVPAPQTVRYAWAGAPDATLTDRSGLPAAPFRTDTLAPPDVDVQRRPAARQVRMKTYEVTVDGNGSVTSLGVGGKQFVSNALAGAGGTSVPGWFGPRELSDIREPGPGRILCGDSEVEVLLDFAQTAMEWTITNRSSNRVTFRVALAPKVNVTERGDTGTLALCRGSASLVVTGIEKVSPSEEGPVLEAPIEARSSRTLKFRVGG
jgi:sialate O-acetylesterase